MTPKNVEYLTNNSDLKAEVNGVHPPPAEAKQPPMEIVWRNVVWMTYIHLAAFYGLYLFFFSVQYKTWPFSKY